MDVKKKLVELIGKVQDEGVDYAECFGDGDRPAYVKNDVLADYLIANGVTVQEWIPVTERLPEESGYPVLMTAVNKYGQKKIVKGFTNYECPVEFCTNEKEYDLCWHCWEVTHWMPMPEPPVH